MALERDRRTRRGKEALRGDNLDPVERLDLARPDEHCQVAEPPRPRLFQQRQPVLRRPGDERRADRGRDRALLAGLDLDQRERKRCPFLGERAGCGREPFPLRNRPLQGRRARLGQPCLLEQPGVDRGRRLPEALEEGLGRFPAQVEPLGCAAQPVERSHRPLPTPGGSRERILGPAALGEERLERRLCHAPLLGEREPSLLGRSKLRADRLEVERCDPGA